MEHSMSPDRLILICATQVLVLLGLAVALWFAHRCYREFPVKRWRQRVMLMWLSAGLVTSLIQCVIIIIGCPQLPVFQLLMWLDRTVLFTGYLAHGLTCWQLSKYYRGQTHG